MSLKGPTVLLAFLLSCQMVRADGGLVDAFVQCTADEIVLQELRAECDPEGGTLVPPMCRVEFEALVGSQGAAAVNRARAAGEAVAAARLTRYSPMQACAALELERE